MILFDFPRTAPYNLQNQKKKNYSNVTMNLRLYSRWNIGTNLYSHLSWSNSSKTCQDNTNTDQYDNHGTTRAHAHLINLDGGHKP